MHISDTYILKVVYIRATTLRPIFTLPFYNDGESGKYNRAEKAHRNRGQVDSIVIIVIFIFPGILKDAFGRGVRHDLIAQINLVLYPEIGVYMGRCKSRRK